MSPKTVHTVDMYCTCTCSNHDWLGFYAKIQIIVWDSAASEQLRLLGVLIDSAVYRISQTFFNQHAGNHWHKYFFLFSHNMFNCFAIRYYTIFVYNHGLSGLPHPRKIMNSPSCCSQPKFLKNHCCGADPFSVGSGPSTELRLLLLE